MTQPANDKKPKAKRLPRKQREAQMLEAAAREFGRQGYETTSMDDIAAACGVTKPMLYNYFGSKDGLYCAMIDRAGSHLVKSMMALAQEPDPLRRLQGALHVFLDFVSQHQDSWRMVFASDGGGAGEQSRISNYRQQVMTATIFTLAEMKPEALPFKQAQQFVEPYAYGLLGAGEAIAQWWISSTDADISTARAAISRMIEGTADQVTQLLAQIAH